MTIPETTVQKAMRLYHSKDYDSAYQTLVQGSFKTPNDPDLLIGLALTLEKMNRFTDCANQWKHIQQLFPQSFQDAQKIRYAAALIEVGNYETAKQLLKDIDEATADQGEKWALIEKILDKTERIKVQHADVTQQEPAHNDSLGNFGDRENRFAGKIVSGNVNLTEEYNELIKNTGKNIAPLRYKSIILVTYGRSGSTLLQGILNTIDGLLMLGENENAFYHLFQYEKTIRKLALSQGTETPSSPFFGASSLSPEKTKKSIKGMIKEYFDPFRKDNAVTCFGFKEVKFKDNPETLIEYLEFLNHTFPQPAFVFLWRDHDEVLNSGWWKKEDRIQASAVLETVEEHSRNFAKQRSNCFVIRYNELHPDSLRLSELFEFVGSKCDPEKVSRIMKIPHSYDPEKSEVRHLFRAAQRQ